MKYRLQMKSAWFAEIWNNDRNDKGDPWSLVPFQIGTHSAPRHVFAKRRTFALAVHSELCVLWRLGTDKANASSPSIPSDSFRRWLFCAPLFWRFHSLLHTVLMCMHMISWRRVNGNFVACFLTETETFRWIFEVGRHNTGIFRRWIVWRSLQSCMQCIVCDRCRHERESEQKNAKLFDTKMLAFDRKVRRASGVLRSHNKNIKVQWIKVLSESQLRNWISKCNLWQLACCSVALHFLPLCSGICVRWKRVYWSSLLPALDCVWCYSPYFLQGHFEWVTIYTHASTASTASPAAHWQCVVINQMEPPMAQHWEHFSKYSCFHKNTSHLYLCLDI